MSLQSYRTKRDFRRTPEPAGGRGGRAREGKKPEPGAARFVVQKHDASRLHYDLRLQIDGALASWAVPKGPSLVPGQKRLAVHVEDHPLEYADFEGVIPEGQYGAGAVMVWDTGTWRPEGDPAEAIRRGKLTFSLRGQKLQGRWTLTRLRAGTSRDASGDNWLLIKRGDDGAPPGDADTILESRPESVKTGRSLEEIAGEEGGAGKGRRSAVAKRKKSRAGAAPSAAPDPAGIAGARKAPVPRGLAPQLSTLADSPPDGDGWIHEIKFDGYRLLAHLDRSRVRLLTRAGHDWTRRFPPIADALAKLPLRSAVIDGEAAILDAGGHTSFQRLQNAIKARDFADLVFFVFDLPYLDGYDLTHAPLLERKEALRAIVPAVDEGILRYSDHVRGGGPAVRKNACELALEGIISKRIDAPYTPRRSSAWLKIKCSRRQEFVVIGWSPPSGSRKHFGSLLLGAYDSDGGLAYTGRVGTGFTAASLRDLKHRLDALERKSCPADEPPAPGERRGVRWVRPELVVEVEFTQWTDDGRLRHPSFQGLREDKEAASVRVEEAKVNAKPARRAKADSPPAKQGPGGRAARPTERPPGAPTVAGVRLSNADRILYPDQGQTKLDVARYYEAVAARILPHVIDRPLSTVRCPRGRAGKCFFQKHLGATLGPPIKPLAVREKGGTAEYISVDSPEGLIALVQFGVLEIHPWGSRSGHIERPDIITFDLDPAPGVPFERVKAAARRVRDELGADGLESFVKTTGGKGLHVVAPLRPEAGWDAVKAYCARVARRVVASDPAEYIATASKAKRTGKIFIDYLRNSRGATAIAPYSTRARPGAPVAMPLRWDELTGLESADAYTIRSAPARIARQKRDPWAAFERAARSLPDTAS